MPSFWDNIFCCFGVKKRREDAASAPMVVKTYQSKKPEPESKGSPYADSDPIFHLEM